MPDFCPLCPPSRPILAQDAHWLLILNENQATLGRVYLSLKRHETDATALTPEEVQSLWRFAGRAKRALETLFAPDHFNYLLHMNLTAHTHMHIYPRYKEPRLFCEQTFTDPQFGTHYDPQASLLLDNATDSALTDVLRGALTMQGAQP